jgi:hypothetical protein
VPSHVPENPVKFKLLTDDPTRFPSVNVYVPPVKLKEMLFVSVTPAGETVMAVDPVLVTFITGVPVTVYVVSPV